MYIPPIILFLIALVVIVFIVVKRIDYKDRFTRGWKRTIYEAGHEFDYEDFRRINRNSSEYKCIKAFLTEDRIAQIERDLNARRRDPLHLKMWHGIEIDPPKK